MSTKHLVIALTIAAAAAPLPAQSVRAGIEAWQRADYPAAIAIWRPLAEKGDADAQFNLGQAYRLGRGVPTNLAASKTWLERAAANGHVDAQTTLGLLLFQNGDQAEGLKWLKQAAEKGEARALLVYGTALYNGDAITQNQVLGYAYVSRAAAQGLEPAKDTLAQLDKLMPLTERKKGVVIAKAKAKVTPPPGSKPRPVQAAAAKPTAKPAPIATVTVKAVATPSPIPATGGWRIQLGAFSQRGGAESLYQRLSGKPALAGRRPFYIVAGAVTRLQVGPFESKAAAAAACRATGIACFAVPAR